MADQFASAPSAKKTSELSTGTVAPVLDGLCHASLMSAEGRVAETPITRDGIPPPAQLEHMAFNGDSERVRAVFGRIPEHDRSRYASRFILSEAVRGGLARLRSTPREAVALIHEERAFVEDVLRIFVSWCRRREEFPRELFQRLLEWSDALRDASRVDEALACCDEALGLDARAFPDLYPRFVLQRGALLCARGQVDEAHAELAALYERLDLVSERNVVPDLILALGRTSLLTGEAFFFKSLLFDGLRAFYTNLDERRTILRLLRRTYRGTLGTLLNREPSPFEKLVFVTHWLCLGLAQKLKTRLVSFPLERGLLAGLYAAQYLRTGRGPGRARSRPAPRPQEAGTLVTRAMGGIGDLLMMTPGLHALRLLRPERPLHLAVPRRFFPLFLGNADVDLLDIHAELKPRSYQCWLNLTDCPAARTESLTAPRVRRNRIEIFARALGVRGGALRRMDARPRYFLTEEERAEQKRFFADHGLLGRSVIGVQLRSHESYRDYANMPSLVEALCRNHAVLLFDNRAITGYDFPSALKVEGLTFRDAAALASGCRALVSPDSAFIHLAGALGLPCVGLFGPTDGEVRTSDYPSCRTVDARDSLPCIPCWRNEVIPCALTGMRASACMEQDATQRVVSALEELLAPEPQARLGAREDV